MFQIPVGQVWKQKSILAIKLYTLELYLKNEVRCNHFKEIYCSQHCTYVTFTEKDVTINIGRYVNFVKPNQRRNSKSNDIKISKDLNTDSFKRDTLQNLNHTKY